MIFAFFNLVTNSAFSLLIGLVMVGFFVWLFRVQTGPSKLFLLSLPFLKIVYDFAKGIPKDSVLRAGLDPFTLPPRHQLLNAGFSFDNILPNFNLAFYARDLNGVEYSTSIGDYLVIWLNRKFGGEIPLIILCVVLTISAALIANRILQALRFEKRRRADRSSAISLRTFSFRYRNVDIYTSAAFSGTPFTGGVFRPYICFPKDALAQLDSKEFEAVIAHELGHISQFDLATTIFVQLLGDCFWFVPGYRWLSRRIDSLREIVADQWAVKSGATPAILASALLKLKEIPEPPDKFVLYSAFFRRKSLLKIRVNRLLGQIEDQKPRWGWQYAWVKWLLLCGVSLAVMSSSMGGNHHVNGRKNPQWFMNALKALNI